MENRKFSLLLIIVLTISTISLIFYNFNLSKNLEKKELVIQNLEKEKLELQLDTEKFSSFIRNISKMKDDELKDPSWEELKTFLEMDDTNELIYNKETFDCSGFAIELFKRARTSGFRCAIVELEFVNGSGHMLNAFQTIDEGLILVDVSGNENGTGKDHVAYVKEGELYGTIEIDGLKEMLVNCDVSCSQFAKVVEYVNYTNLFDYTYFSEFKNCREFYEECIDAYNKAVDEYNKGIGEYSSYELNKWFANLEILENQLTRNKFYIITEGGTVKNIQIYW